MKWSEVKWSEVKWSEVKWSEVKWSEVKWSELHRGFSNQRRFYWQNLIVSIFHAYIFLYSLK